MSPLKILYVCPPIRTYDTYVRMSVRLIWRQVSWMPPFARSLVLRKHNLSLGLTNRGNKSYRWNDFLELFSIILCMFSGCHGVSGFFVCSCLSLYLVPSPPTHLAGVNIFACLCVCVFVNERVILCGKILKRNILGLNLSISLCLCMFSFLWCIPLHFTM